VTVTITGASGFIGRRLVERLRHAGHLVRTLGRSTLADFTWDALSSAAPLAAFEGADAVVHLAGEPIAQRWNAAVKKRILDSRVTGTRNLVEGIAQAEHKPGVLVSASAIGYYGDTGETPVDETAPLALDFLAAVTRGWEEEAERAEMFGVRVVRVRIGIVLGKEGGALAQMLPAFRLGAGGPLGSGRQWMSWIHVDDLISLFLFAIDNAQLSGPANATSPNPVRNSDFTRTLGEVLHRPTFMPVPEFLLHLRFGEVAPHLVESSRVLPAAATRAGFVFQYPEVLPALRSLLA
jgi:uncharacterized protein